MQQLIFGLFGGTALLLLGIEMLGDGLERAAGEAMKRILHVLTSSVWRGVALGTVVTSIIQSSSATTVMVVGFVNAGMMTLSQALGVIYGANIGTTITAQLLRLKITEYALPIVGVGMIMHLFARKDRLRHLGYAMMGFGVLFHGLTILSSGSDFLTSNPQIKEAMQQFASNPLIAVLLGGVFTGLIQSSSAATGLVIALANVGLLNLQMSAGIILGCNIGTCVTAMLASMGSTQAARRTAMGHLFFNAGGVLLILPFFYPFTRFIESTSGDIVGQIANMHTIFNVTATVVFIPFTKQFANMLYKIVPGEVEEVELGARYLDKLLLNTPDVAIEASIKEIVRSNEVAMRMLGKVHDALRENERQGLKAVSSDEELLNLLQKEITRYMVDLAQCELTKAQSQQIPAVLHMIGDVERVGDHAYALIDNAEQKISADIHFSEEATLQMDSIFDLLKQLSEMTRKTLQERSQNYITESRAAENEAKRLIEIARHGHIERLEQGTCSVEAGIYYLDVLSHYERIAEHFRNTIFSSVHQRMDR